MMTARRSPSLASWVVRTTSNRVCSAIVKLGDCRSIPAIPALPTGFKRLTRPPMSHSAAWSLKLCSVTAFVFAALSAPANAQQAGVPQVAVPVVQAVPQKSAGMRLNDALNRLARNPQDISALGEAGQASVELGDAQAAIGFYRRAMTIQPGNPQLKVGLASAYVLSEDPFTAIDLFDEAEKAGPIDPARLADRGLAFDLVGDAQTAQTYYRQSLAAAPSDETLRRLGLSQAILRDRKGMDTTLAPLLQKQDKAAWRTRAFGLAIMGQAQEAEAIAYQTMTADMAGAITAYLRYMPRLTPAQQAAAGNLGRFPRASEIGNDDPRVAAYTRTRVQVAAAAPVAAAPSGKGRRDSRRTATQPARTPVAIPPPEPQVSRETASPQPQPVTKPAPVQVAAVPARVQQAPIAPAIAGPVAAAQPVSAPREAAAAQPAALDLARAQPPASAAPVPVPVTAPIAQRRPASLDEAFADLAPPSNVVEPKAGAVDVRAVRPVAVARRDTPAKEPASREPTGKEPAGQSKIPDPKAKDGKAADPKVKDAKSADAKGKDAKGKDAKDTKAKPSHPSRIWVQVAAGRNKPALAFDWRKFAKEDPAVFKGQKPFVTTWGQTNRLLTGPFASAKEADAFVAKLKKAGREGAFAWTSPAGQVIDELGDGK